MEQLLKIRCILFPQIREVLFIDSNHEECANNDVVRLAAPVQGPVWLEAHALALFVADQAHRAVLVRVKHLNVAAHSVLQSCKLVVNVNAFRGLSRLNSQCFHGSNLLSCRQRFTIPCNAERIRIHLCAAEPAALHGHHHFDPVRLPGAAPIDAFIQRPAVRLLESLGFLFGFEKLVAVHKSNLLVVELIGFTAVFDDIAMVRCAEHSNALLVHIFDGQFSANERHHNLDGFGAGQILSVTVWPQGVAIKALLADGFCVRFCPEVRLCITDTTDVIETLGADSLKPFEPDCPAALRGIGFYALFFPYPPNNQLNAFLVPPLRETVKNHADDFDAIGQVHLAKLTLASGHCRGVEVIPLRQVLVHLCREHLVDV
nr:MAG TPA: hypothetical protein [Caudoviricetes sp.]